MNNEYGGLITNIDKIVEIITKNPEKMKKLNLLQLAQVVDDVEALVGEYDKEFLLNQGITEKQAIYRGYLAYKTIILKAFEENPDIAEYIDYLSNKDYVNTLKQAIQSFFIQHLKKCIISIYNNRYRKNPNIGLLSIQDIYKHFNLDDNEENKELEGYFDLLELSLKKDGISFEVINQLEIDDLTYIKLAKIAVSNYFGYALEFVDSTRMDMETYKLICSIAVSQDGYAIKYVHSSKMSNEDYTNIVLCAAHSESKLNYIDATKIDYKIYISIIATALLHLGILTDAIDASKISFEFFEEILSEIVRKIPSNFVDCKLFFDKKIINDDTYIKLAKIAISKKGYLLKIVDTDELNHMTFLKLAILALKSDPNIITENWFKDKFKKSNILSSAKIKTKRPKYQNDKKHSL